MTDVELLTLRNAERRMFAEETDARLRCMTPEKPEKPKKRRVRSTFVPACRWMCLGVALTLAILGEHLGAVSALSCSLAAWVVENY